jgi:hypothetical protein
MCVAMVAVPALAAAQAGQAQEERRVEGGVKAGVTTANLSVSGLPGFEPESGTGAMGGGWISFGRDRVRVQTELTFGTRRFSSPSPIGDIEVSARVVEIPVLILGRWRPGARTRPQLFGGPSFGLLSRVTQTVGSTETDIDDEIRDTDIGFVFGGGVEIGAGRGAVVIDARYTHGLRDVSESSVTSFKLRTWAFSFGYRF